MGINWDEELNRVLADNERRARIREAAEAAERLRQPALHELTAAINRGDHADLIAELYRFMRELLDPGNADLIDRMPFAERYILWETLNASWSSVTPDSMLLEQKSRWLIVSAYGICASSRFAGAKRSFFNHLMEVIRPLEGHVIAA